MQLLAIKTHTEEAEASLFLYYEFCRFLLETGRFTEEELDEMHQEFCLALKKRKEANTSKVN